MKWGYVQPVEGTSWNQNQNSEFRNLPPTYLYTCGDITIEAVPAIIYDYTYSVGPWMFPVIPVFNIGGNSDLREEFSILLRLSPREIVKQSFALHARKTEISITAGGNTIQPSAVRVNENRSNFVFVNAMFKTDLHNIDSFLLNFDNSFPGCPASPLRFEKVFKVRLESLP